MIVEIICPKCDTTLSMDLQVIPKSRGLTTEIECKRCKTYTDITFDADDSISLVYVSCDEDNGNRRKV